MSARPPEPGLLRLAFELFLLPVQTLLHGMERMVETLRDMQRITDRGADAWLGRRALPPAAADAGAPWPPAVPRDSLPQDQGHPTFREPRPAGGARDGAGGPTSKEESRMYLDQDLSGNMVKVVQYCIVSVVTSIDDNARVIVPPQVKAFADDMTPEDFTSWVIAEDHELIHQYKKDYEDENGDNAGDHHGGIRPWDRKYLRVAFSVMGRFSPADIDWTELQAKAVARIAASFPSVGLLPPSEPKSGKAKGGS